MEENSQFKKGRIPWNKGLKGVQVSWNKGTKGLTKPNSTSFTKGDKRLVGNKICVGKPGWSKGLTKLNNESLRKMADSRTGDRSNLWKGGLTESNKLLRMSSEYKFWRTSVYKRDNYLCKDCGYSGKKLTAHHIKSFSEFPELRLDINNGVTLCHSCHKKTDNYGVNKKLIK